MRLGLILILFFLADAAWSQSFFLQDGSLSYDSSSTSVINIEIQRIDQSNAISREMIGKFFFGGHISDSEKGNVRDRLDGENYYGGELSPSINYTFFQPGKSSGWSVSYHYRNLNTLAFADDLYTLFFYGNNEFLEEPAFLNENSLRIFNYQSLSFGWVDKKTGSNFRVGVYDNRSFSEIDINQTTLTTGINNSGPYPFADEILLQAGTYSSRQSSSGGIFSSGIGFGLSGEYTFQIDQSRFILGVDDFGAMHLNNMEERDTSGVFEYRGFEWEVGEGSPLNDVFSTLEDSLSPNGRVLNTWVFLPALLKASYISPDFGKFYLRADGSYRLNMGFRPELGLAITYRLENDNAVWVRPVVGGFNDFSVGLGAQFAVFNNTLVRAGSNHLFGVVDGEGTATSLFLQIVQKL